MLGHASAAMTPDIYGHLWPSRLGEAADAMEAARAAEINPAETTPQALPPTAPQSGPGM
ncbi:MAG: hypothetical protein LBD90_08060 [Bifidobacteriaceae bacterium]|jgi:hypothetical protein|nr:hypothetical protein [Bifidobacteriaceae bacterium]